MNGGSGSDNVILEQLLVSDIVEIVVKELDWLLIQPSFMSIIKPTSFIVAKVFSTVMYLTGDTDVNVVITVDWQKKDENTRKPHSSKLKSSFSKKLESSLDNNTLSHADN